MKTRTRASWGGLAAAAMIVTLAGCKVGPDYVAPPGAAPDGWSEELADGVRTESADLATWWKALRDPTLDSLVDRAIKTNLDLREASARVRETRALRGVAEAGFYPTVDATASYTRERFSENNVGNAFGVRTGEGQDLFAMGFDAAWEIDIFGRVAREVEAADAQMAFEVESWRDVLVSLLAELALEYTQTRSLQQRLAIAEANVKAQEDTLALVTSRFNAGITSELDVAQAKANLEQTRSQIPLLTAQLRQSMHRLEILVAQRPGSLLAELTTSAGTVPVPPDTIAVGLPSELLRRRSDVRRAERDIAAETARIGVVTADLFPRVMLTGNVGLESSQIGTFIAGDSFTWAVGPGVRWNIFSAGRIQNNIEAQTARQEQALARYEKTVLTAFHDVEDALVGYARERVRLRTLTESVNAQARAVQLAEELYTRGLTDFQNVLDAQRQLYSLQDLQAESERDVTSNVISLYKALGGGWEAVVIEEERAAK